MKKLALISQLLTVQILTNDDQVLILCLSYLITTVWTKYMDTKKMKYISAALFPDTKQRYNHYVSEDIQMYFAFAFAF